MNIFSLTKFIYLPFPSFSSLVGQILKSKVFSCSILLFSLNGVLAQSANYEWAFEMGTSSFFDYDYGQSITVDNNGDIIVVGAFNDSIDCDPGLGEYYLYSSGNFDCFIQKLDPNKNLIWAKRLGGTSTDKALSVTVDSDDNIYATGSFANTVDFDPGPNYFNLNASGGQAAFVMKLNSNGDFIWAKRNHGSNKCEGRSIALDPNNNILVTGIFEGTPDFNTGTGNFELTSNGYVDAFVQKLDNNGDFIWASQIGGVQDDDSYKITSDSNGNVYTVGEFHNMVDFDPGIGTFNLSANGFTDGFVQKLDPNGNFQWVHRIGDQGQGSVTAITIDINGNLFIAGNFYSTVDFDSGTDVFAVTSADPWYNAFIQKLNLDGEHIWVKTLDAGAPADIVTDASGNIYTAGTFEVDLDFDPSAGVHTVQTSGMINMFIHKLDPDGNFLWVKSVEGLSDSRAYLKDIDLDVTGNIYSTGYFWSTMDFDPNTGVVNLTSNGAFDIFVYKLSQGPVTSLNELCEGEMMYAYPNPSHDGSVNVVFDQVLENATITVMAPDGSIVAKNHFSSVKNTQVMIGESKGVYLLTVDSNSGRQTIMLQKL